MCVGGALVVLDRVPDRVRHVAAVDVVKPACDLRAPAEHAW